MSENLLHGPLEDRHRELGASFAEFGGWLMPVSYAGTVSEHNATRNAVGLFDVSHLGKALVKGPGAADFVNSVLTNDLRRIGPGKAQYTLCCTETGGVIDDLIAYYVSDDEIFLVPNAANTAAVVAAMKKAAPQGITITDEHRSFAVLAVDRPSGKTLWVSTQEGLVWQVLVVDEKLRRWGSVSVSSGVGTALFYDKERQLLVAVGHEATVLRVP